MKNTILLVSLFLVLVFCLTGLWLWRDMQVQLQSPLKLDRETDFIIQPGMTIQSVSRKLEQLGMMKHSYYLLAEARRQSRAGQIKAGEYVILPGTTPLALLDQFVAGKVKQYAVTLIEGWTFAEVMNVVKNHPVLEKTAATSDHHAVMSTLGEPDVSAEGQFFPDTYHFPRGTTDIQFLQRAHAKMREVLAEEWRGRAGDLVYKLPYEALIMASIIEKETSLAAERVDIAGVFMRRLQHGMKLQTDPTVIFAMGHGYNGNIRRKDLEIDSPYNTYLYTGLPPTPIALAGRASLHAALHPARGSALYFVAKGDGSHHFSETLAEHNAAVAKYQLNNQKNEK